MTTATKAPAGTAAEIEIDLFTLVRELIDTGKVRFTFHTGGSVGSIKTTLGEAVKIRQSDEWIAAETEHWRLQIRKPTVAAVWFVEETSGAIPVGHSLRFVDQSGNSLVRAYFPSPYLDDVRNVVPFREGPLDLFREFFERYGRRPGVRHVQIGRVPKEADVFGSLIDAAEEH